MSWPFIKFLASWSFIKLFKKNVRSDQKSGRIQAGTDNISKKEYHSKIIVSRWVINQKALGTPLCILMHQLWDKVTDRPDELELSREYLAAANKIEHILVSRNLDGKQFEADGKDGKAIKLYEENIKDKFDGSHPYDRLRIIYTRHNKYDDVIRVCQSYIDSGQEDPKLKARYKEIINKLKLTIGNN